MRWHDKFIPVNTYGYQNWQGGDIQLGSSFHNVKRSYDHEILQGQVKNRICYISTTKRPMAIKLKKMVTYHKKLLSMKSQNPLKTWSHKLTWWIKIIIFPLPQCTYNGELPSMITEDFFIMWLCRVTWQIEYAAIPLGQWPWLPNLAGWLHVIRSFFP